MGSGVAALLSSFGSSDVQVVSNSPDPGDRAIIEIANSSDRTIVTRDSDFVERRLCTINQGVIYIPQEFERRPLLLPETFRCITRLLESGRLNDLGHGTCTVTPDGISIRTREGEESIPSHSM